MPGDVKYRNVCEDRMKIAVCLSGQPRTVKYTINSIKNFFSDNYQFDFFCHTWNYNDFKVKEGDKPIYFKSTPADTTEFNNAVGILSPKKVVVDTKDTLANVCFPWDSMLYSCMMANQYKRQYEIEHNFTYDIVVKSRYDLIFPVNQRFTIDDRFLLGSHHPLNLYTTHNDRMPSEYYRYNISDVIYYGSSWAMDIACDLFWYAKNRKAIAADNICNLGPGTLMSEYIKTTGLSFQSGLPVSEVVYRDSAIPLNPETNYDEIVQHNIQIYK
jgi:hypothetical protein